MVDESSLRKTIGLADACELLARTTAFPDEDLADGLSDGRLAVDARSCLEDCGIAPDRIAAVCEPWEKLAGEDRAGLFADLRRAHSLLFMRQGHGVAVWPYESAFLHTQIGKEGEPVLFRSSVTLAVEQMMRDAGVLPADSDTEPSDSVWNEFVFLSYLLGSEAEALDAGNGDAAALARSRSEAFVAEHAFRWLPGFFDSVERELPAATAPASSADRFYRGLSSYGACIMDALARYASPEQGE